jgi:hypothetical protein
MKSKIIILTILTALSSSQTTPPAINQPTINQPITFKDGDIVYFESTKTPGAFLWSKFEDCKRKNPGDTCGDAKGYASTSNQGTRYVLTKGPGESFCLELYAQRRIFLFLRDISHCKASDNECGSATNIAATQCLTDYAFNLFPAQGNGNSYFALRSLVYPNVFLRFNAEDCANRVRDNKPGDCGNIKGRYTDNLNLNVGDNEVFKVTQAS